MSPCPGVVLYGASGYTGAAIARAAAGAGLSLMLAGRNGAKVARLAAELGLPACAAHLDDAAALKAMLRGARVLVNAAGPFSRTAEPLLEACLAGGVHYLDITGEVDAFAAAAERDREARRRGILIMPGVGFDVVPSDCLAGHVAARLRGARSLRLGIAGLGRASRGSARTIAQQVGRPVRARRRGRLEAIDRRRSTWVCDFGKGPRECCAVDWGDLVTAYYTTGIPDITTYFESTPMLRAALLARSAPTAVLRLPAWRAVLEAGASLLPEGPTAAECSGERATIVAEVEGADGRRAASRLETPEVYSFTVTCAVRIARLVANGDWEAGFQTPARLYGSDFVLTLPGVTRWDLPDAREALIA